MRHSGGLTPEETIEDIALRFPAARDALRAHGIDAGARGDVTLAAIARSLGLNPWKVLATIVAATERGLTHQLQAPGGAAPRGPR